MHSILRGIRRESIVSGITVGLMALATLITVAGLLALTGSEAVLNTERIGLIEVSGVIYNSRPINRQLEYFTEQDTVPVILLRINSPGGGVAASQEVFRQVNRVKERHPDIVIISSMGSVAASGAYYIAAATDTIMANPGTITGSIGVIAEFAQFDELLDKIGVSFNVIKTGPYKDTGSAYRPMRDDEREYLQALVDSSYEQFIGDVAASRGLPADSVRALAGGRIYSGTMALHRGLVDTLGNYEDAVALAKRIAGYGDDAQVVRMPTPKRGVLSELIDGITEVATSPAVTLSYRMR